MNLFKFMNSMKKILIFIFLICGISSYGAKIINAPEGERFDYIPYRAGVQMPNMIPTLVSNTDSTFTLWIYKCVLSNPYDPSQRLCHVGLEWARKLKNKYQWNLNNYFKATTFYSIEEARDFVKKMEEYMEKYHDNYENAPEIQLNDSIVCYPAYNNRFISLVLHPEYYYLVFVNKNNNSYFGQILRLDLDCITRRMPDK